MGTARHIESRGRIVGGGQLPVVCVPLVATTAESLLDDVDAIIALGPDLIEWRADFFAGLGSTQAVLGLLDRLADRAGEIPLLFTVRSTREGGQPTLLSDAQVAVLCEEVCRSGRIGLVDTELAAPEECRNRVRDAARASGTQLVLSYHNFSATPDAGVLYDKFALAQQLGADVGKVAVMPGNPSDVLTLLAATLRASETLHIPLISMSMGPMGALTRVAGWMFGSSLTFAAGRGRSAPGQLQVEEVKAILGVLRRAVG